MSWAARVAEAAAPSGEAALAERWAAGVWGPLRLEDGRQLRVVFPGIRAGAAGPDFQGAIVEVEGDLLEGDVEVHLRTSGWRAHGHGSDPAYRRLILHVVGENDTGASFVEHGEGRRIPLLVLPRAQAALPAFAPPCTGAAWRSEPELAAVLRRLSLRRLRMKVARFSPLVAAWGAPETLWRASLEQLGVPANREAFRQIAARWPLAALAERSGGRADWAAELLRQEGQAVGLRSGGSRPMGSPALRLRSAALLLPLLVRGRDWPQAVPDGSELPRALTRAGLGRTTAIELAVNVFLPVGVAAGVWSEERALRRWWQLPAPPTYGLLRPLQRWLGLDAFPSAGALQGALLLLRDYCTRGQCGRCPLS